jgi:inosine-uridine nucleoside N-ribohydrolase
VKKVVLDMDTGVDDALAIVLAMNAPELDVVAITTVAGNVSVEKCTRNSLLLTEILQPDDPPPVAEGASTPLVKQLVTAPEVHGPDGLGGELGTLPTPSRPRLEVPAHEVLTALPRECPGEITLVATGPLTNVARALREDRTGMALCERLVIMGGAFGVPGNTGPVAEFNFYVDPEAAQIVMDSGLDITLVPLDVTTATILTREVLEGYRGTGGDAKRRPGRDLGAILYRALDYYIRYQLKESGLDAGYMHDPLAVASVIEPSIVTATTGRVEVVPGGKDRGRSFAHPPGPGGPEVRIATSVDARTFARLLGRGVLSPTFGL